MLAVVAAITFVSTSHTVVFATMGANHIITPTNLRKCLLANLLVLEVVNDCDNRFELCEIYHNFSRFTVLLFLCHKGIAKVRNFPVKRELFQLRIVRQKLKIDSRHFRGQQVYSSQKKILFFRQISKKFCIAKNFNCNSFYLLLAEYSYIDIRFKIQPKVYTNNSICFFYFVNQITTRQSCQCCLPYITIMFLQIPSILFITSELDVFYICKRQMICCIIITLGDYTISII